MKKLLKRIVIALLVCAVLPLAAWITFNLFDDTIDPKAAAYGEPRASAVPDAENGYFAAIAMSAPDGVDGMKYASAWVAEARAAAKENRRENRAPVERAKRLDICDAAQASCVAAVRGDASGVAAKLDPYREDMARYEKLLAFRRYEEILDYPMRLDAQIPQYQGISHTQRAYLLRAALAFQSGNVEEGLSMLEREFAFQRVMLEGTRTLIGKMIAHALYQRDLCFVLDVVQHFPAELRPHAARLTAMMQPVNVAALRMDRVFESEFAFVKQAYKFPSAGEQLREGLIFEFASWSIGYKKNATLNKAYEIYSAMAAASLKPASSVSAEWKKVPMVSGELSLRDYFDNPIGKVLLGVANPAFDGYVLRMHDLDAFNRLVGLRVQMLAEDVGAEGAAAFVANADARFHDPYTGKPMGWDAASKRLSFKPSEATAKRKLIYLDQGRLFAQL